MDGATPVAMRPSRIQSRNWTGTIWSEHDLDAVQRLIETNHVKYGIISAEDSTEEEHEGRQQKHWHCLIMYDSPRGRPSVTQTAHWEVVKDCEGINEYIEAKGDPLKRKGIFISPKKKKEQRWNEFKEACKTKTPKEMIDGEYSLLYARYRSFAGEIQAQFKVIKDLEGPLINEWIYGDPGTGKSRDARKNYPGAFCKNINKWWDGYNHEETVIIDDWGPEHYMLSYYLKIWADRYAFNGEVKGSSIRIRPKRIVITSNYTIEECFEKSGQECIQALRRRFKVTHYIGLSTFIPGDNRLYEAYNNLDNQQDESDSVISE